MKCTIDLRSDTVTQPSPGMREAISQAKVGDDVYGEDPTVTLLEETIAKRLGQEAALFVPSGSMADQIAIQILTRPGDAIMTAPDSHIAFHEAGATPFLSGTQFSFMPKGRFTGEDIRLAYHENDHHYPPTTLLEVENTYNMGGGQAWAPPMLQEVVQTAKELGMKTMLDGARLWNAALATQTTIKDLSDGFDCVTICLSKGLGAPVGSLIAGSQKLMHQAHRIRKMLGGGMRQAGFLAAAGLYAIENNIARLTEDHKNATFLGESLASIPGLSLATTSIDTNIVMVDVDTSVGNAEEWRRKAKAKGLYFGVVSKQRFRLVTHLNIGSAECENAITILKGLTK